MNTESDIQHSEKQPNVVASILKLATAVAIFPVVMVVILFVVIGQLGWIWAWVYLVINLVNVLIVGPIMIRTNPVTIAEHEELEKTEKWDVGSVLYLLAMYIALPLVAGLDVYFGWAQDLSIVLHVTGASVLAVGLGLASWAMIANPYIWSDVPIQHGQTICSVGPYRFMRHPAYAGLILQALGVPILLGSLWALVPGIMAAVFIIVATSSEDRILQDELPGYQSYAQKVRFRLFPGIW
jgi:protein-S-isoprenylcysteine O-methyltransferase Ste14